MANDLSQVADKNNPAVRRSVNLLPVLFRTDKNSKFLAGTLDQLIQAPQLKRVDGWVGSKITPTYNKDKDFYLESNSKLRQDYQLEPALVVTDEILKIIKSTSYDDLINQLSFEGANVSKLNRLFKPRYYSYNPHINWDKFVNFENYYWLPNGPDAIPISNSQKEIVSTYNVTDTPDGNYFVFTPDGLTPIPQLTLYRGVTYKFNVSSSKTFWIKSLRISGTEGAYRGAENNGIKEGVITLFIDNNSPKTLYFVSEEDAVNGGEFIIQTIDQNTSIDVEKEIIGKQTYRSFNGVEFTSGLKIKFVGDVTPEFYKDKQFIVEGVGTAIKLIDIDSLSSPEKYAPIFDERFDNSGFDDYGFDQQSVLATTPDYITINRASQDRNPWSRYNRWFHEDVIKLSAEFNKVPLVLPFENRAKRPIIEFESDFQLYNFGSVAKPNVQFIDTSTKDVFSMIEGQTGYYVDGEELGQGDRIIFTADNDEFVNGKTFVVNFVNIDGRFLISLDEDVSAAPQAGDSIVVTKGNVYKGTNWWYNGSEWVFSQQKTKINQPPKFDIFDINGISYSDTSVYNTLFTGSNVFGYDVAESGINDPVLGFPLVYKNIANQGYYLFKNYFMVDKSFIINKNIDVSAGFLKRNINRSSYEYQNVWSNGEKYEIPVLQYQVIDEEITDIEVTAIANAGYQQLEIDVFLNNIKQSLGTDYTLYASGRKYFVIFKNSLKIGDRVLLRINTAATVSETGQYEPSIGWTNNPLNHAIDSFTLTELTDHVKTIVDRHPDFKGTFPGSSNLRDLFDSCSYGTRLVSHENPLVFAGYFIANDEHNLVSAIKLVGKHYNQFKLGLIDQISKLSGQYSPIRALDIALYNMNVNKDVSFPYSLSDMLGYGTNAVTREYKVTDSRNKVYSISSNFDLKNLSTRSILVYHTSVNGTTEQLLHGSQYEFDLYDTSVHIKIDLEKGDVIRVDEYPDTAGCYIPPTPTKLGLYPKFEPRIFVDNTYSGQPQKVIQGHDGSVILAYNDFRDEIILEFERRVFNNIKSQYNPELLNINSLMPGAFRNSEYSAKEINDILSREFLKWDAFYGFNYSDNVTYSDDPKTWNYSSGKDLVTKLPLPGNWRAVYKFFFDTDRPHTHPWEMLGFTIKPEWWESTYGPLPYTRGNSFLWDDLENGMVREPGNTKINPLYVRKGLSSIIPVDDAGNLLMPAQANIATDLNYLEINSNWKFGDQGPVEAAWRRSSAWPFAVQILMALTKPADYAALMFDVSRMKKSPAGHYVYGEFNDYISFDVLKLYQDVVDDVTILSSGYSVFLIEAGNQKNRNYLSKLKKELSLISSRLAHKVGGFVNKDKFKIIIDSVNPTSTNPGVALSQEDYQIFLDKSSPVQSLGVSGVILQKTDRGYSIRGYDTKDPYFNCLMPIFTAVDPATTIGGKSEPYVEWTPSNVNPMSGLDTTSVSTNSGYRFYKQGQIVKYQNNFYRTKVGHNAGTSFNPNNFQRLSSLPILGGVAVRIPSKWEATVTQVSYGQEFDKIEDVYSVLIGYGRWLESQGLIFDSYNSDLGEVINWTYSSKEAIFWATQNWAVGSVITLSPFADTLKFKNNNAVVDNLTNIFYEYSILKADGAVLPSKNISVFREENNFVLKSLNTTDGVFFVRLNLVQKEHTVVLNNNTQFNDAIYDIDTGYRQRRIKLAGFVTDNWNGDLFSPGFVYDEANISSWQMYQDYSVGDVVFFAGNYYSANKNISGSSEFDYNSWNVLGEKPIAELLPNFDYKISQFEDFYSLDVDNFDLGQQELAQHLIGYSPRTYLDNIFVNPISQYKFYQGFIKEKGTRNTIDKLGKASIVSQGSFIDFFENWALRIGEYGSFATSQNLEVNLDEREIKENPQLIKFVEAPPALPSDFINYKLPKDVLIKPDSYESAPFKTTAGLIADSVSSLPIAGYVRLDDITATAFNSNSLLDIANNGAIKDGDTIWLGFQGNGDWDVYRYTQIGTKVIDVDINIPGSSILFTTDDFHGLAVGDIISVSQFDSQVDGVYTVLSVPQLNQILVSSVLTSITVPLSPGVGLIFKFVSSRFENFDSLSLLQTIEKFEPGEKVWIDNIITDPNTDQTKWAVYQKVDNFESSQVETPASDYQLDINQRFGYSVAGNDQGTHIVISAPNFNTVISDAEGKIYTYRKSGPGLDDFTFTGSILPNISSIQKYFTGTNSISFGQSLKLDRDNDVVYIGAPTASGVKYSLESNKFSPVSFSNSYLPPQNLIQQGFVKLTRINFETASSPVEYVYASPEPQAGARFGHDLFIGNLDSTNKILFVSSPNQDSKGAVHFMKLTVESLTSITATAGTNNCRLSISGLAVNANFGHSITGSDNASRIAVSALGEEKVYIFSTDDYVTYSNSQIISITDTELASLVREGDNFGTKVLMDRSGEYLFISAPRASSKLTKIGKIFVMKFDQEQEEYILNQVIDNPFTNNGYDLGISMDIAPDGKALVVSCVGSGHKPYVTFDTFSKQKAGQKYVLDPSSAPRSSRTTFDSNTVNFFSTVKNSGAVFTFVRENDKYIFAENLVSNQIKSGQIYGRSVFASSDNIIIGAPGQSFDSSQNGFVYFFDKKTDNLSSWQLLRQEEPLVDLSTLRTVKTINIDDEAVEEYLEIIDPVKGKISGIADQELKYKSIFDPAVYSIGVDRVVIDSNSNWLDEHVGELWWDISSVKYVWYEQGELEFRKNNWNKTFPGSMIDVYEWVKSPLLPSQWSSVADTNEGLAQGISGQPKFADNSVLSVKQVWDPVSNSFSNVYYYWVKNKITIPENVERRVSCYNVAALIADPKGQGVKYISVVSPDAIMLTNLQNSISGTSYNLSIDFDSSETTINKHTEWLLVQEGNDSSMPSDRLFNKMVDSLLGVDREGNSVPDLSLPSRLRYGVGIRPRQTMFKDRFGALRVMVQYVNSVLAQNNIVDLVNLEKFNSKDEIPNSLLGQYDFLVEDLVERDFSIVTRNVKQAKLSCSITNGRISSVEIVDPGFGYGILNLKPVNSSEFSTNFVGPTVKVEGTGIGAVIETEVNIVGEVVKATIINSGFGYTAPPTLTVRPFTVIVQTDSEVGGKWSRYIWDYSSKKYIREYSQAYDTTKTWKFIDWVDSTFDHSRDFIATIDEPYQLAVLTDIPAGNYVKIRNAGDGRAIVLRKVFETQTFGSYNKDYDLIFQEKGTIKINEDLWNYNSSVYGWDQVAGWDQTNFDETPEEETKNIVNGILDDIFVNYLKVYKNKLFFKLVKYALTEQKFIDWAFKTSLIDVVNNAGELDQRPFYKLNNESYYQDYINESKPYHTKIRNFTSNYTATDVTNSVITDFDLPSVYNTNLKQFTPITFGSDKLTQYPWKSWTDNYGYFVESIEVYDGGSGYTAPPKIEIVPQTGDTGSGARAIAYIALGKVTKIEVIDSGSGYTATPIINLVGGGPTDLTPAKVSIRMANGKVRTTNVYMKFDRVSGYNEVQSPVATDTFTAPGDKAEFVLTWAPNPDKNFISVRVNGLKILSGDYSIKKYITKYKNYSKKRGSLVLVKVPPEGSLITIEYRKDLSLYNAIDRIRDYYEPTDGMPGNTATLLMSGLEYPGVTIDTLPFKVSTGFDSLPFGENNWDDFIPEEGYYEVSGSTTTSIFTLPYVPQEDQRINVYVNGLRIDGSTSSGAVMNTFVGNGFVNTININTLTLSTDVIGFRLETSDGSPPIVDPDLDTYLSGGYFTLVNGNLSLTKADDLEDIAIDGDSFVSTTNSYGPEENVPGRVSDSLGINVFTYSSSTAAMVINKRYITDPYQTRYAIGTTPPSVSSVEVLLDNNLLEYGVNYTIDYSTNEIILLDDPLLEVRGPYFSPNLAIPRGPVGQAIASNAGDDTFTGPYPLGFEWNMFGSVFTEAYVGTNGFITFGGGDSEYTPLTLGILDNPAIYVEYCDLWQDYGLANNRTTPLATGETPGLFFDSGTVGNFNYWRLRFQGGHYNERNQTPTIPAYQYELVLYSDGTNQYVEMIYGNTWRGVNFNGDVGFITGIARSKQGSVPGAGIQVDDALIASNSSHVFYSTSNGGNWQYAGEGSFDAFKNQNPIPQVLSITTMNVGGQYLLGHESLVVSVSTKNNFEFMVNYENIKSSYITVNGVKQSNYTLLGKSNNGTKGRVIVRFNSDLTVNDVLQVWFFAGNDKAFSEVKEQVFSASTGTRAFVLSQPPGNIAPLHNQVIVEKDGLRLIPPDTVYYIAEPGQRQFAIEANIDYPTGAPDRRSLEIYVNGVRKNFGPSLKLLQDENLIEFGPRAIKDGDAVAITYLRNHDYTIDGSSLVLTNRVDVSSNSIVKVTTFTNHDASLFRRERFQGTASGLFKLSRPVVNSNYVWVEVNGRPLTRETEFRMDRDNRTVIINSDYNLTSLDNIVIMSVTDQVNSSLVGYRMFYDILGRTHYKRLSRTHSTQLAADLSLSDNHITVEDAEVLTPPNLSKYRPGVILIDGERIEFTGIDNNKLTGIRRGTLGTGVKFLHKEGSTVVDQGHAQNIPVLQNQIVWTTATNVETSTWDAFVFAGIEFSDEVPKYDQIDVYYQGRRLRKPGTVFTVTDTTIAYDSDEIDSLGRPSNVDKAPEFTIDSGNLLVLGFVPTINSELKVIAKTGNVVGFEFADIHQRSVEQVNFLLETPSFLPDKYYYGQNTTTDQYWVLELGDTIDDESGNPLIGS